MALFFFFFWWGHGLTKTQINLELTILPQFPSWDQKHVLSHWLRYIFSQIENVISKFLLRYCFREDGDRFVKSRLDSPHFVVEDDPEFLVVLFLVPGLGLRLMSSLPANILFLMIDGIPAIWWIVFHSFESLLWCTEAFKIYLYFLQRVLLYSLDWSGTLSKLLASSSQMLGLQAYAVILSKYNLKIFLSQWDGSAVKVLAAKLENLSSIPEDLSTWKRERIKFHKFFSDFHTYSTLNSTPRK